MTSTIAKFPFPQWVIVDDKDLLLPFTIKMYRRDSILRVVNNSIRHETWKTLYRRGYRCVRINLSAEVRR